MDGEEEVLVGRGANYVCRCEEFPVQHGCILEKASAEDLQGDDTKDDILRERFVTTELGNLRRAEALFSYLSMYHHSQEFLQKYYTSGCALIIA